MDSNLSFRIIPCLDVKDSQVVKGINFVGLKEVGSPVSIAKKYNDEGADELVFLDITASNEKRSTMVDIVKSVSKEVFIPFTVGGGIRNYYPSNIVLNPLLIFRYNEICLQPEPHQHHFDKPPLYAPYFQLHH